MDIAARQYLCVACRKRVVICTYCDRGNRYCSEGCAVRARKACLRAAAQRYQTSLRGRLKHAQRQRCYRARIANKVTHHGSPTPAVSVEVTPEPMVAPMPSPDQVCCTCSRPVCTFVRLEFLRCRIRRRAQSHFWSVTTDDFP